MKIVFTNSNGEQKTVSKFLYSNAQSRPQENEPNYMEFALAIQATAENKIIYDWLMQNIPNLNIDIIEEEVTLMALEGIQLTYAMFALAEKVFRIEFEVQERQV